MLGGVRFSSQVPNTATNRSYLVGASTLVKTRKNKVTQSEPKPDEEHCNIAKRKNVPLRLKKKIVHLYMNEKTKR